MEIQNNKLRILIVDDEPDICEILEFNLENEGFEIDLAESAEEAMEKLTDSHRLILLDVMMGGMSGFRMAEKLRKSGNNIPIIFLTAKDTENDMLTGFSIGGDDYISKPFSIKEVIARIKTVLKRMNVQHDPSPSVLRVGDLYVDVEKKTVMIDNSYVDLTKTEYEILVLFLENEHKLFTREAILNKVWRSGEIVLDRTVDVHITRLRKKIGIYGNCIINRTGYGYSFNSDKVNNK